jgi:hypothetical protein
MTTYKKKLFAAASAFVAGATPAALFAGAGTGHADALPNPSQNFNGTITVVYTLAPFGLSAVISDNKNPVGVTERCHYHSVGTGGTAPIPFDADTFPNGAEFSSLFIPTMQLGGTWDVTVSCDHGGQFNYKVTW